MAIVDDDLTRELEETVAHLEAQEPAAALKDSVEAVRALLRFEETADEQIGGLIKVLSGGGIFTDDIVRLLDDAQRKLVNIHAALEKHRETLADPVKAGEAGRERRERMLAIVHKLFLRLYRVKAALIEKLETEMERAHNLAEFLRVHFDERKLYPLIKRLQERKLGGAALRGSPEFITTSVQGGIHISKELFDLIEGVLITQFGKSFNAYFESLGDYSRFLKLSEEQRLTEYEQFFRKEADLLQHLVKLRAETLERVQEASIKLRDKHKYFQRQNGELKHFLAIIQLDLARQKKKDEARWKI